MAGITDGNFCKKLVPYGFDMVTLGGYNADKLTIAAGHKIIQRGRSEFDIKEEEIMSSIKKEAKMIKKSWNGMVSVNLRSVSPDPMIEISKITDIDVLEINAHCRQPEITDIGCGQGLLYETEKLYDFTKKIVDNAHSKVSVKIRANIENVDDIEVAKAVEEAGADYLHVDAMKPGYNHADLDVIKSIKENTNIFLIGNNSLRDLKSAREMISAGADGISIARAALKGNIPFDLSMI
ncbi:MAG: tRNA-dihydrouridine synthase [Methanobacterium sp.]|uniref:MJ0144 family RNA dihydrouridine synthase-like protein n=1 Tax=Methanobacterium sp. TaxID=2164 RepID=UPI003D66002C|nr:tRNA-dihydrouridine synthase [Methanobacterium sp.]